MIRCLGYLCCFRDKQRRPLESAGWPVTGQSHSHHHVSRYRRHWLVCLFSLSLASASRKCRGLFLATTTPIIRYSKTAPFPRPTTTSLPFLPCPLSFSHQPTSP